MYIYIYLYLYIGNNQRKYNVCSEVVTRTYSAKTKFLKISQKFTGKHLYQSLFFNKVTA